MVLPLSSGHLPSRNFSIKTLSHDVHGNGDTESNVESGLERPEHAVISTFDLFSIGGECL